MKSSVTGTNNLAPKPPKLLPPAWQCSFGHCQTKAQVLAEKKRFYELIQADQGLTTQDREELINSLILDSRAAIQVLPWQTPDSQEWALYEDHVRHYNLHLMGLPYNRNPKRVMTAAELREQEGLSLGDRHFAKAIAEIVRLEGHWISNPYKFFKEWASECNSRQERLNPIQFSGNFNDHQ